MNNQTHQQPKDRKLSPMQTLGSALKAVIGIQSRSQRERDSKQGSAQAFIIAGLVVTISMVLTLVIIVRLILNQASP